MAGRLILQGMLTVREAARVLRRSEKRVYVLVATGRLGSIKTGTGGRLIPAQALEDFCRYEEVRR